MNTVVNLSLRNKFGAKASRDIRNGSEVPVVIYSKNNHVHASLDYKIAKEILTKPGAMINQLEIQLDSKSYKVLIKDVQYHPLSGKPIHIDFIVIEPGRKMRVNLPLEFPNKDICPGIKLGGILNVLTKGIKVVVSSDNIPSALRFDLAKSAIGDSIKLKDINLPEGAKVLRLIPNTTLATIIAPSKPKE